ncbi:MAG: 3-phosphoglycerate dehydrogenase [Bacteroidales bacterium]|nr:3-phosphoglycerate dehydrogenase [Bacteroidales bacterium]
MKVLVATEKPFAAAAVNGIREIVEKAGHELVLLEKYTEKAQLLEAVADADALIVRSDKVTAEVVEAAKDLKIVVRAGAGYDNIDLKACTDKNIVVENTPGQNSNAVAELAIGLMIYISRNQFTPGTGSELSGKRLGIQGFGNIGQLVAKKAVALGMDVVIYTNEVKEKHQRWKATFSLEHLYSSCDFISINIPATPFTMRTVDYNLISKMPKGGCLINTSRKEIICEDGLEKALSERPDLKYATDIAPERYAEFKEKFGKQIFATPKKQGAETGEANINAGLAAAQQICDFFETGSTKFKVNK